MKYKLIRHYFEKGTDKKGRDILVPVHEVIEENLDWNTAKVKRQADKTLTISLMTKKAS